MPITLLPKPPARPARRSAAFQVRCTVRERRAWRMAARRRGLTLAEMVRALLDQTLAVPAPPPDAPAVAEGQR